MKYNRVAIIDSGLGGKLVGQRIKRKYPGVEIVQYTPKDFVSYSNMKLENLFILSKAHVDFAIEQEADLIIVGCMTLSTNCLNFIKSISPIKVLDVYSNLGYLDKSFTIIATENTIRSGKFSQCVEIPCGHLSGAIENKEALLNKINEQEHNKLIKELLEGFIKSSRQTITKKVILGCTHYPLALNQIKQVIGNVEYIDPINKLLETFKND